MNPSDHIFKGSRVIITGAAGFIGANLIRKLLEFDIEIYGIVRKETDLWRLEDMQTEINFVQADLNELQKTRKEISAIKPNYVFHLAVCRQNTDWKELIQTNIAGTVNVLESTKSNHLKRFVQIGSSMEYGRANTAFREESLIQPTTFYGASKAAATLFTQQFARSNQTPFFVLRMFYVYGYMEPDQRLIPVATKAALFDKTLDLTDAKYCRDFVFIDDAVDACLRATSAEPIDDGILNIASGKQWTNEAVVSMIEEVTGRTIRRNNGQYPPRNWDHTNWVADISEAKRRLGWTPKHSLKQGLTKTIKWILEKH